MRSNDLIPYEAMRCLTAFFGFVHGLYANIGRLTVFQTHTDRAPK